MQLAVFPPRPQATGQLACAHNAAEAPAQCGKVAKPGATRAEELWRKGRGRRSQSAVRGRLPSPSREKCARCIAADSVASDAMRLSLPSRGGAAAKDPSTCTSDACW